jgi:DNA-binding transcriptional MerR regulator
MLITRVITKRLLTPQEAADYWGISERQLEYLREAGFIHQTRLPDTRKRLYDVLDLDALIEKCHRKNDLKSFAEFVYLQDVHNKKT